VCAGLLKSAIKVKRLRPQQTGGKEGREGGAEAVVAFYVQIAADSCR
jgi:hypothetical protein